MVSEELLKRLPEKAAQAVKDALAILQPYLEDLPDDVRKAIQTLVEAVGYGYPEQKDDIAKKVSDLIEDYREFIEANGKVLKSLQEAVERHETRQEELSKAILELQKTFNEKITGLKKSVSEASERVDTLLNTPAQTTSHPGEETKTEKKDVWESAFPFSIVME